MKTMCQESILRQFVYELEEWGRLLLFFKQENVIYKSRLSEIVSTTDHEEVIMEAENFNEDFLSQDRMFDFLTDELRSQNKLVRKDWKVEGETFETAIRYQKKLRTNMEKAEEIFSGTKKNFTGFLSNLL